MKIPVRNSLHDLAEIREVLNLITAELLHSYNVKDLDKCTDIFNLQCIIHRLQNKILTLSHRHRSYKTKHWITLPELATVARVVEAYCFRLDPYYQVVLRENLFNQAYQVYYSLHNTKVKQ